MGSDAEGDPNDRAEAVWTTRSWLPVETLAALAAINEQCLTLMCEQAAALAPGEGHRLWGELHSLWCGLDAAARGRAAECPCLLIDCGFLDAARWGSAHVSEVHDQERTVAGFFTVAHTSEVARVVLAYAWHLVRSQPAAARLLLGVSAHCAQRIAACPLPRMMELAQIRAHWLQPRWADRPQVWRRLLLAASSSDPAALEEIRLRALPLLAADVRAQARRNKDLAVM
jgi:hypothetical protein